MSVNHVEAGVEVRSEQIIYTDKEAMRVKKKLDLILLPLLCGCYIMSVSSPISQVSGANSIVP